MVAIVNSGLGLEEQIWMFGKRKANKIWGKKIELYYHNRAKLKYQISGILVYSHKDHFKDSKMVRIRNTLSVTKLDKL